MRDFVLDFWKSGFVRTIRKDNKSVIDRVAGVEDRGCYERRQRDNDKLQSYPTYPVQLQLEIVKILKS